MPWAPAMDWAKEQGKTLPTRAQWMAIQEHRDEINAELEKAGLKTLGGWYWSCEEYLLGNGFAWCVGMGSGRSDYYYKGSTYDVRAVSAFPSE